MIEVKTPLQMNLIFLWNRAVDVCFDLKRNLQRDSLKPYASICPEEGREMKVSLKIGHKQLISKIVFQKKLNVKVCLVFCHSLVTWEG